MPGVIRTKKAQRWPEAFAAHNWYPDPYMELLKKTTILFPPDLYGQLAQVARQPKTSAGELVREACRAQYSLVSRVNRLAMVNRLAALSLPVGTPGEWKRESVPAVEPLP